MESQEWKENIILIDADYADHLIFEISVQLERMLERQMPKVDLAQWLDYLALDGGLRPGDNQIQVLFLYSPKKAILKNFTPASLRDDWDGKSFKDKLGEFQCASFPVESELVTRGKLFVQSVQTLLTSQKVKRLLLVPDFEECGPELKDVLNTATDKSVTLLGMAPQVGYKCPQDYLSYSIMAALGVKSNELP